MHVHGLTGQEKWQFLTLLLEVEERVQPCVLREVDLFLHHWRPDVAPQKEGYSYKVDLLWGVVFVLVVPDFLYCPGLFDQSILHWHYRMRYWKIKRHLNHRFRCRFICKIQKVWHLYLYQTFYRLNWNLQFKV